MKTKLTLSLWIRQDNPKPDGTFPIYCRLQVSPLLINAERRAEIRTKFSVKDSDWDSVEKRVIGNSKRAEEINTALTKMLVLVQEIHRVMERRGERPKPCTIRDEYHRQMDLLQAQQTGELTYKLVYYPTQTLKTQRQRLERLVRMQGKRTPESKPLRQLLARLDKVIANRWDAR